MSDLLSAISKPEESIKRKEIQLEVLNRENVGLISILLLLLHYQIQTFKRKKKIRPKTHKSNLGDFL